MGYAQGGGWGSKGWWVGLVEGGGWGMSRVVGGEGTWLAGWG